jgi:hypothetical protein
MAINFPTTPSVNQHYSYNGRVWKWNGNAWTLDVILPGFQGTNVDFGLITDTPASSSYDWGTVY